MVHFIGRIVCIFMCFTLASSCVERGVSVCNTTGGSGVISALISSMPLCGSAGATRRVSSAIDVTAARVLLHRNPRPPLVGGGAHIEGMRS